MHSPTGESENSKRVVAGKISTLGKCSRYHPKTERYESILLKSFKSLGLSGIQVKWLETSNHITYVEIRVLHLTKLALKNLSEAGD